MRLPRRPARGRLFALLLLGVVAAATGEPTISVDSEVRTSVTSGEGGDDWRYGQSSSVALSYMNHGSRRIRGELELEFIGSPESTASAGAAVSLSRLYLRPSFGPVLATVGKSRSSWGAGYVLNAGDIIFGSESPWVDLLAREPRSETAWLTNVEVPFGAFSFVEVIALPGAAEAGEPAPLHRGSVGGRVSVEAGPCNLQSGYLYRGDNIAGIDGLGHRAYLTIEGIAPVSWHLSSSITTDRDRLSPDQMRDSLLVSAGFSDQRRFGLDRVIALRLELLARPANFGGKPGADSGREPATLLYGAVDLTPRPSLTFSARNLAVPGEPSAEGAVGGSWALYESLVLSAYYTVQLGSGDDTFGRDRPGAIGVSLGARYVY